MAILAEEIVEEWLRRDRFFTIRGIKIGNDEIDLLAVRAAADGQFQCRHIEVQVSFDPIGYISKIPNSIRDPKEGANSAKLRDRDRLRTCVEDWVTKKFRSDKKKDVRRHLCDGAWSEELVVHAVRSNEELDVMRSFGIKVIQFSSVLSELRAPIGKQRFSAEGGDLMNLILRTNDVHLEKG